jgi:hypothetical protein
MVFPSQTLFSINFIPTNNILSTAEAFPFSCPQSVYLNPRSITAESLPRVWWRKGEN